MPQQNEPSIAGVAGYLTPDKHLCDKLVMALAGGDSPMPGGIFVSSTELDSPANMVVLGKQAFVFSQWSVCKCPGIL